jgi:hypothetical protein
MFIFGDIPKSKMNSDVFYSGHFMRCARKATADSTAGTIERKITEE